MVEMYGFSLVLPLVQVPKVLKLREVHGHKKDKLAVVPPDFVSVAPFNMAQHDNAVAATAHLPPIWRWGLDASSIVYV